MDVSGDDLAGVVDLFGGLTRPQLQRALEELAYKRGEDVPGEHFAEDVDAALESYHLVAVDAGELDVEIRDDSTDTGASEAVLVAGPVAFPSLPDGAADLPHILNVPDRSVDAETAGLAARDRLLTDADRAAERGDADRAARLLDVSYDLETWAPVDASEVRARLDDVAD